MRAFAHDVSPRSTMNRRDLISVLAAAASVRVARGETWPARAVRIISPLAAGGGIDATARILAARLAEIWRQQVVVENKTGASGNIAAEYVARSEPDGYTLYIASFSHATNRFLYPSLGYDPVADFAPVTLIATYPLIMVVPMSSPAHSVKEFIAYAKSKRLSYASSGNGTSLHLAAELFMRTAAIEMTHVPYRGAGLAFNDLIPGRVDVMINFASSSLPLARQGALRVLATPSAERLAIAPDVPTMAEAGVPGVEVWSWDGLFLPAKTPIEIVGKVHSGTVTALADPAIRTKLEQGGAVVTGSTPDALASFLHSEMEKWGAVIKEANIRAQ
jgi:tripartite-type tricarboxylate transporter receptor subunit TctC